MSQHCPHCGWVPDPDTRETDCLMCGMPLDVPELEPQPVAA